MESRVVLNIESTFVVSKRIGVFMYAFAISMAFGDLVMLVALRNRDAVWVYDVSMRRIQSMLMVETGSALFDCCSAF